MILLRQPLVRVAAASHLHTNMTLTRNVSEDKIGLLYPVLFYADNTDAAILSSPVNLTE